ncbi:riboflavin biosynthesis protein RibD [Prosthecochloris sp. GSB1]|nr:riboflavin biosynthesis protein RibD [Prosthecochloris sp. GSB1]
MSRCLELAVKGAGFVSPNPMVGSVIVCDGRIVGEGFHQRFGGPHAEVNAIASVTDQDVLRRSTLYVNLEPCSHYGKTPPCSDLIVERGIPRVVVACRDPHEKVAGKGIDRLRAAGVEVVEGILEQDALRLNEAFMKSHRRRLPFVALKLAQTLDGKIATANGLSKWITGEASRREVHLMRSRYDAVLTGSGTVLADDPLLTVRHAEGRNPLRVVLDRELRLPPDAAVFGPGAKTLLVTSNSAGGSLRASAFRDKGVEITTAGEINGSLDLSLVLRHLHERGVLSVLVEAGGRLSSSFVREGLADKLYMFVAPKLFGGDGLSSFAELGVVSPGKPVMLSFRETRCFDGDIMIEAYFT